MKYEKQRLIITIAPTNYAKTWWKWRRFPLCSYFPTVTRSSVLLRSSHPSSKGLQTNFVLIFFHHFPYFIISKRWTALYLFASFHLVAYDFSPEAGQTLRLLSSILHHNAMRFSLGLSGTHTHTSHHGKPFRTNPHANDTSQSIARNRPFAYKRHQRNTRCATRRFIKFAIRGK